MAQFLEPIHTPGSISPREPVYIDDVQIRGFWITHYNFWAGVCNDAVVDRQPNLDDQGYDTVGLCECNQAGSSGNLKAIK